jgi:hypothetical protein
MQYFAIGGLERMVERLSVGSQSRGIETLVIAYLEDGPIRGALADQGVRTLLLDGREGLRPELVLGFGVSSAESGSISCTRIISGPSSTERQPQLSPAVDTYIPNSRTSCTTRRGDGSPAH